ncbi:MAG: DUF6529 family protein [Desulfomicrobium escambiense]|nr:DUF6529 family protein [Desulfomicrobium escambiense]
MGKSQKSLEEAVNFCIEGALKGKPIDPKSDQMNDMVAYIKSLKGKAKAEDKVKAPRRSRRRRKSKAVKQRHGGEDNLPPDFLLTMNLFLIKSGLSVLLLLLAGISTFTMLEVFGRSEKRYNIQTLKTIHRVSGIVYLLLFLCVAYLCVHYLVAAKSDLTPRNTIHVLFALSIFALLSLKVLFVKVYRQFYPKVQTMGLALSLLTVGLFGFSGGFTLP